MEKINLPKLNLPEFEHRIEFRDDWSIWDPVRKKFLVLNPEEWVRQNFIQLLHQHLEYPLSLMKVEAGHKHGKLAKRTDIEVINPAGGIKLLVECKSPETKLNKSTLNQLSIYNKNLDAEVLAITNGLQHFCWKKNRQANQYDQLAEFPKF